jgi:hypothetical protein
MSTNNILNTLNTPGAIVEKEGPREDPFDAVLSAAKRSSRDGVMLRRSPAATDEGSVAARAHKFDSAPVLNTDPSDILAGCPQDDSATGSDAGATTELGPNNEHLDDANPRVVAALRDLMLQFRSEGLVARRHEVRRIKQARLFWQGLQYAWWNPNDMSWHLPFDPQAGEDKSLEEMPRYQFVTNLYQAFGLSFIALISQDTPATRFYPQSAQIEVDVAAARAASDVAALVEDNNKVQQMLTGAGYFLWTDGKIGGYVRYVADAQRFGWHNEDIIEEALVRIGEDAYVCPKCNAEVPCGASPSQSSAEIPRPTLRDGISLAATPARDDVKSGGAYREGNPSRGDGYDSDVIPNPSAAAGNFARGNGVDVIPNRFAGEGYPVPKFRDGEFASGDNSSPTNFLAGAICPECGAPLGPENFHPAPVVSVPRYVGTRRVPNGQEVITILGGLELNTPVWANEMHEFPYLQWQQEVHIAKLRAAYPHAADKIILGGPVEAEDVYARASRVAVAQGMSSTAPGDALYNLITFTRTWIRPWAFYAIEDKQTRDELLAMFPDGCYVAFAGETYCESRNETLDDHWRVMHALPGDGQNRPSVGDSLIQIQERYNTLSNIQAETYEFGIPPIYADPQVLDFDALASQTAEPAAHYPARAKPGQPLASSFFQPAPAQISPDMLEHQQDLAGPIAQFLTGLFPAVFGGVQAGNKTAAGYAMARDQALGRLGIVWRRLKQFYADIMLLSVDTFRKNRASDVEIPLLGDLKGNIQAHPEADESFPRQASQQRAVLQQLMTSSDPLIQQALGDPENIGFIKGVFGLNELVVPGEDAREKQLREITQLLASAPIVVPVHSGGSGSDVIPNRFAGEGYPAAQSGAGVHLSPPQAGMPAPHGHDFVARPRFVGAGNSEADATNSSDTPQDSPENPSVASENPGAGNERPRPYEPGQATNSQDAPASMPAHFVELPSVPVDDLLDDHAAELAEVRRWASSDAGQIARAQNPVGFANVRAHAAAHQAALSRQSAQAALAAAAAQSATRQSKAAQRSSAAAIASVPQQRAQQFAPAMEPAPHAHSGTAHSATPPAPRASRKRKPRE